MLILKLVSLFVSLFFLRTGGLSLQIGPLQIQMLVSPFHPELNDIRTRLKETQFMSWGYCLGDHKATAFPALKSSSVVLALAERNSAKSRGCDSSENPLSCGSDGISSAAQSLCPNQLIRECLFCKQSQTHTRWVSFICSGTVLAESCFICCRQ